MLKVSEQHANRVIIRKAVERLAGWIEQKDPVGFALKMHAIRSLRLVAALRCAE